MWYIDPTCLRCGPPHCTKQRHALTRAPILARLLRRGRKFEIDVIATNDNDELAVNQTLQLDISARYRLPPAAPVPAAAAAAQRRPLAPSALALASPSRAMEPVARAARPLQA